MRIVQVGMGRWGRDWAVEVIPQIPELELVGCVDTQPAALAATVKAGIATESRCFPTLEAALVHRDTAADAVLVTTDMVSHVDTVRRALAAGKPVLCEKPLAPSLGEARAIVDQAEAAGLCLMVSQNYRFFPAVRAVQQIVADRSLGELVHISLDFRRFSAPGNDAGHRSWTEPLLYDMSIHHFDLMRAVTGLEAESIYCRTWNPAWAGFEEAPEGTATITFRGGLVVSYRGTWICPTSPTPWAGEWRMAFEAGEVWWTSRADRLSVEDDAARLYRHDGTAEVVELPPLRFIDRAGSLAAFMEAVASRAEPETSARDNLGSLAITYAAADSARLGEPVLLARAGERVP